MANVVNQWPVYEADEVTQFASIVLTDDGVVTLVLPDGTGVPIAADATITTLYTVQAYRTAVQLLFTNPPTPPQGG